MPVGAPGWLSLVRDVPDFPEVGITFKDISPLLASPADFAAAVDALAAAGRDADGRVTVDKVAAVEARGFLFAAPMAVRLGVGLVPVRKAGKLPGATYRESYALEYGESVLEVHTDAFAEGERVLLVDDVLATGGTLEAAARLVARAGASVTGVAVLIELAFLDGRSRLNGAPLTALITT